MMAKTVADIKEQKKSPSSEARVVSRMAYANDGELVENDCMPSLAIAILTSSPS
jgi:hypothetical protein